jgi:hypothetical protein
MMLGSTGFVDNHGDLKTGIIWSLIGLGLFAWPVMTGYFNVVPERHYIGRQQQ